jgi:hypothetical protein
MCAWYSLGVSGRRKSMFGFECAVLLRQLLRPYCSTWSLNNRLHAVWFPSINIPAVTCTTAALQYLAHIRACMLLGVLTHSLCSLAQAMASFTRFLHHTQRSTTVDRTPLDEWSARRRDLYLTTHITDKHLYSRWDSNTWSHQASGRRPAP